MYRSIDVRTEMRKLASSKPVHAAAGAGLLASQALRELPVWLARWRGEASVNSLPAAMTSLPSRASGYVVTARAKAVEGYDRLADRGKRALAERGAANGKSALNGKGK